MAFYQLYLLAFFVSITAIVTMALRNYKNIDIALWSMQILIMLIEFGYINRTISTNLESALFANNLIYLESTVMPALFLLAIMRILRIRIPSTWKKILYALVLIHVLLVWFGTFYGLYYKNPEIHMTKMGTYFTAEIGYFKIYHYIYMFIITAANAAILVYGYIHPQKCPLKTAVKFTIVDVIISACYLYQNFANLHFAILPLVYPIGSWMITFSYERTFSHNIDGIVTSMHNDGYTTGYFAFDMRKRFLGATETACKMLPQLKTLCIDQKITGKYQELRLLLGQMMNNLDEGNQKPRYVEKDGIIYQYKIKYFYIRKRGTTGGYIFSINDDTEKQKNLNYIQNFNKTLKEDVLIQTSRIKDIQERVVLGLANTIENRDSSTGGHVKRTSDVVRILVNTMMDSHIGNLDTFYAERIIRAAPMHDLGKIAIDNSILCKAGKLTPEEYEIMKTHPVKSGEIVNYILNGVEEQAFVDVAFNCARYHHERWDGKGYPDHLSGSEIPLEARIMATADVYDALVSKRCYKQPMTFEQAAQVMLDNMGTHFDPMMKEVFELSRPELEAYYSEDSLLLKNY